MTPFPLDEELDRVDFFMAVGSFIMQPLYWIISAILLGFHRALALVMPEDSGWTWGLSIVGLTIVIRMLLIPLFVKQIKSSRNMQLLQPRVKELQKKYGHDRERLAQETMALYKETGTNPFASCLPLLLQMPIFLALFRLLDKAADGEGRGLLTDDDARLFGRAELLGAQISDTFLGTDNNTVRGIALVLVLAMTATTFITQRQLMAKNMPPDAMTGPYAQQQKMLLYILPPVFGIGGIAFPIGVLLYWTTSNLWTMAQQFYVIRNNPAPGTPAFDAKAARDRAKAERKGERLPEEPTTTEASEEERRPAPRQQPKKQSRRQRKKGKPGGSQRPAPGTQGPSGPPTDGSRQEPDPNEEDS